MTPEDRHKFLDDQITKTLALQIRMMRKQRGWSIERLAKESGLSYGHISRLESGRMKNMRTSTLEKLASAFDVGLVARFVPWSALVQPPKPFGES